VPRQEEERDLTQSEKKRKVLSCERLKDRSPKEKGLSGGKKKKEERQELLPVVEEKQTY